MNPKRKKRLYLIVLLVTGVSISAFLMFKAFQENMNLYYEPVRVAAGEAPKDHDFRMGGMVVKDSVRRNDGSLEVMFDVTDYKGTVTVYYNGILPDLFRDGQGIITRGRLDKEGKFIAEEVLAKHDENYMPPEVAESLKQAEASAETKSAESQ